MSVTDHGKIINQKYSKCYRLQRLKDAREEPTEGRQNIHL